jgi:hypothetical protein
MYLVVQIGGMHIAWQISLTAEKLENSEYNIYTVVSNFVRNLPIFQQPIANQLMIFLVMKLHYYIFNKKHFFNKEV